jgi:hypothetical protein
MLHLYVNWICHDTVTLSIFRRASIPSLCSFSDQYGYLRRLRRIQGRWIERHIYSTDAVALLTFVCTERWRGNLRITTRSSFNHAPKVDVHGHRKKREITRLGEWTMTWSWSSVELLLHQYSVWSYQRILVWEDASMEHHDRNSSSSLAARSNRHHCHGWSMVWTSS